MPKTFDADRFAHVPPLDGGETLSLASELLLVAGQTARVPGEVAIARDLLAATHAACLAAMYGAEVEESIADSDDDAVLVNELSLYAADDPPAVEAVADELLEDLEALDDEFATLAFSDDLADRPRRAMTPIANSTAPSHEDDAEFAPVYIEGNGPDGSSRDAAILLAPSRIVRNQARRNREARSALFDQIVFYAETLAIFVDADRPATRLLAERLLAPIGERNERIARQLEATRLRDTLRTEEHEATDIAA